MFSVFGRTVAPHKRTGKFLQRSNMLGVTMTTLSVCVSCEFSRGGEMNKIDSHEHKMVVSFWRKKRGDIAELDDNDD